MIKSGISMDFVGFRLWLIVTHTEMCTYAWPGTQYVDLAELWLARWMHRPEAQALDDQVVRSSNISRVKKC